MKKGFDRFDLDEFECKLIELQSNYNNKLYINSKDKDYYKEVIKNFKNIDDMRMNEISWQRMVYMNHSANVVPAGKPYKKQMLQGKVFPITKAQARNFVLMGCLLNELNNEDVRVVELILNKHGIVGNYSYAKKKGMVRLVNSCDLDKALRMEYNF